MNVGSKYQDISNIEAISLACLEDTIYDAARLGESRQCGKEWSKYSKRWGSLRRIVQFLWSTTFIQMTEVCGLDDEYFRDLLLKIIAGKQSVAMLRDKQGRESVLPEG